MTPVWKSQRGESDVTLEGLIWSSAANRLPARSRLCSGQLKDCAASGSDTESARAASAANPEPRTLNPVPGTLNPVICAVSYHPQEAPPMRSLITGLLSVGLLS